MTTWLFCIAERLGSRHLLTHFRATWFVDFPQFLSESWFLLITQMVHPRKLTCPLKRDYLSREYIFQPLIFRGHASFQGSTCFFFLFFPCFLMFLFLGLFSFPRAKTSPLSRDEPWLPRLLGGSGSTKACWTGYPFQEMGFLAEQEWFGVRELTTVHVAGFDDSGACSVYWNTNYVVDDEKISGDHHLGYIKLCKLWDIHYQPQLVNAGFRANHQQ